MRIGSKTWERYLDRLSLAQDAASRQMLNFMLEHVDEWEKAVLYGWQLVNRYGGAAAAAACEMFDALASAAKAAIGPAVPAEITSILDFREQMRGAIKANSPPLAAQTVGRAVKAAGLNTTVQNAMRAGCEIAWVPVGDTCPFCVMLASRGWMQARSLDGYAEHVHANCDCTYAVRFSSRDYVEGYDPAAYRRQYDAAEGRTWQDKLNAMRRDQYAENAPTIRAQQRAAYAARQEREQ